MWEQPTIKILLFNDLIRFLNIGESYWEKAIVDIYYSSLKFMKYYIYKYTLLQFHVHSHFYRVCTQNHECMMMMHCILIILNIHKDVNLLFVAQILWCVLHFYMRWNLSHRKTHRERKKKRRHSERMRKIVCLSLSLCVVCICRKLIEKH